MEHLAARKSRCARTRRAVPVAGRGRRRAVPDAWRKGSGAPRGNRNARKHGVRSAEFRELVSRLRELGRGMG